MSTPINDALVVSQATRSSERPGAPDTRLRGRRLILARVVWVAVVTLIAAFFLVRLPAYYTLLQTICTGATCGSAQSTPDFAQAMQRLGLSVSAYAAFTLALTLALAFLCFTLGAVIFWRRSDDWMALLGALAVVASVALNPNVYGMDMTSAWGWIAMAMYVFGTGMYVLVLSLSDGRFVTPWARWLLLCWGVAVIHYFIFMNFFYSLVWLAALGLLLIAQASHRRTASSPLQRQQGKWFIFGGGVEVIITVGSIGPLLIFPSLGQAGSFYQLVTALALIVLSFIFPLCIGLAILRYRLYDIDLIIHRTLVYSTLTVTLALVYFGLILSLQSLVHLVTGTISEQPLVIVASTLAIAALFQPLRRRIQRVIDRRFYRRKYDAARIVAAFSATLRHEVDLSQLSEQLMMVVEETMQPTHVSLWLRPPEHEGKQRALWRAIAPVSSEER